MNYFLSELFYEIPWVAFAVVALLTIALPALHLILATGRALIGRDARINWWVLGRIVPLGLAIAVIVPLTLRAQNEPTDSSIALAEVATIFLLVAAIVIPIALPLLQAYVQRLPRLGTALYTLMAILALPVAGALATQTALVATNNIERAVPIGQTVNIPVVFLQDQRLSDCKVEVAQLLPDGFNSVANPQSGDRGYRAFFLFWVDMTLKATFLDFFEIFDCGVSDLSNNPKHLLISSFVFIYRAFVELIVLATIALPFLGVEGALSATIAIIDYGSGNLASAAKALERAAHDAGKGQRILVTARADDVAAAERIVLPGVGAFADCMAGLARLPGMIDALSDTVINRGRPFLGICVGMQLMATRGLEHGEHKGFAWIAGDVVRLSPNDAALKIPHMGWNTLRIRRPHALFENIGADDHAYFLHSYHLCTTSADALLAEADYGGPVTAAVGRNNLVGVQFHPEKSQRVGLHLLQNFLKWRP